MIEYQVDEQMLEEVQAKLGEMSRKAPTVISRAPVSYTHLTLPTTPYV